MAEAAALSHPVHPTPPAVTHTHTQGCVQGLMEAATLSGKIAREEQSRELQRPSESSGADVDSLMRAIDAGHTPKHHGHSHVLGSTCSQNTSLS